MKKTILIKIFAILVALAFAVGTYFKMTETTTKVHVLMPVYNTAPYIEKTLNSVINQTLGKEITLIIYNDGTTDASIEIAKQVLGAQDNINYKMYEHQDNQGVANARTALLHFSHETDPRAHFL